ncbi:hypothetical protein ABPG74_017221 [Tetrahymena malaccensis]
MISQQMIQYQFLGLNILIKYPKKFFLACNIQRQFQIIRYAQKKIETFNFHIYKYDSETYLDTKENQIKVEIQKEKKNQQLNNFFDQIIQKSDFVQLLIDLSFSFFCQKKQILNELLAHQKFFIYIIYDYSLSSIYERFFFEKNE